MCLNGVLRGSLVRRIEGRVHLANAGGPALQTSRGICRKRKEARWLRRARASDRTEYFARVNPWLTRWCG